MNRVNDLVRVGIEDETIFPYLSTGDSRFMDAGFCPYMSKMGKLKLHGINIDDLPDEVRDYILKEKFYDWCVFLYRGFIIVHEDADGFIVPVIGNSANDTYGGSFKIEGYTRNFYYPQPRY